MAVSICAFNSKELDDQELIADGLNLFVKEKLSDMFSDLLVSRDLATGDDPGELDQIARILEFDPTPLYQMSNYWDEAQKAEHLSRFDQESERSKQLEIIQTNNDQLIGNIDVINALILTIETGLLSTDLEMLISRENAFFYDDNRYFSNKDRPYAASLLNDLKTINTFVAFVQSLDADTLYFKFSPSN